MLHLYRFVLVTLDRDDIEHASTISTYIEKVYLSKDLDKHHPWFVKIGLGLLNFLMIVPLFIPSAIKYAITDSFFFSTHGKSQELIESLHDEMDASMTCLT